MGLWRDAAHVEHRHHWDNRLVGVLPLPLDIDKFWCSLDVQAAEEGAGWGLQLLWSAELPLRMQAGTRDGGWATPCFFG
jgi:hypothetical protein